MMRNAALIAGAAILWFAATAASAQPEVEHVKFEAQPEAEPSVAAHAGHPVPASVGAAVLANLSAAGEPLADREIDVESDDRNVITLSGEVSTEAEKALAGRIAADTQTVTEVRNLLVVRAQ